MFVFVINLFKALDKKIVKVMVKGVEISLAICMVSMFVLLLHIISPNYLLFNSGILLFKASSNFFVFSIICGIVVNTIR